MDSFFECIDKQLNNSTKFWNQLQADFESTESKIDCSGTMSIKNKQGNLKARFFYLVDSQLYYCKSQEIKAKRVVIISWKTLKFFKSFEENFSMNNLKQVYRKDLNSDSLLIRLGNTSLYQDFLIDGKDQVEMWTKVLTSRTVLEGIYEDFSIVREIGQGKHSTVNLAYDLSDSAQYSIKAVNKSAFEESFRTHESLASEVKIMRKLSHPHIVSLHYIYEDASAVYFILDHMGGGDLFQRIILKNKFSESVASKILKNLLSALEYLHSIDVIYRDLKPSNVLFTTEDCDYSIKINNFYLACDSSEPLNYRCGSPGYVAPEILKKKPYNKKVDIFSSGVILYNLLSGRAPFVGKKPGEIYTKNKECKIYFQDVHWKNVSKEGVDCVLRLTDPDPEFRPTASEALTFTWFRIELSSNIVQSAGPCNPNDAGISAELMKRMNRARCSEEVKREEDSKLTETQKKSLNANSKNFLSRLRGFDSLLKG